MVRIATVLSLNPLVFLEIKGNVKLKPKKQMKAITKLLSFAVVMVMFILLDACKAEKGEVGPIGPAGANGANGANGTIGATGATGATGTANVIYSDWATVTFTGSGTSWSGKITAPKITQDILDKGVVKAYFKFGTDVYEGSYVSAVNGAIMHYFINLGAINIRSTFNATYLWRYIIIPGGVGARKAAVDYSDYEAVKKYHNLPD